MTTAKQIKKAILKYEPVCNELLALLKEMETGSSFMLGRMAHLQREAAFSLFQGLHDIHDELAKHEDALTAAPRRGQDGASE